VEAGVRSGTRISKLLHTRGACVWGCAFFLLLPSFFLLAAVSAQSRPLPDDEAFFAATRENLARANRLQNSYAYKERRTELHMNPFGRIGTGGVQVFDVTPGPDPSVYFRRLLEEDGKRVTDSKPERQERRIRTQGRSAVEDTVETLRFAIDRRETIDGRDAIVIRFEPRPDADPQTREGRMAKVFQGQIWVDEEAREVMRVEAVATDDLSYGFGLLARLNEGTVVTLTRAPVEGGIWLPTSIRFKGQGRALLFRKLNVDYVIEWFDYRRVTPANTPSSSN
jgi:hypothetical protein